MENFDEIMQRMKESNWNENGSVFHEFNSSEELYTYLHRSNDGIWWDEEKGRFDFEQCKFNFDVKQWINEFDERAIFKGAEFVEKVSFEGLTFKSIADFRGCIFRKNVDFSNTIFENESWLGHFNSDCDFSKAKFFHFIHLCGKDFEGIANFSYTSFKEGADFSDSVFSDAAYFNDSSFGGNAAFIGTEFKGKVNAWNVTFCKDVTFKWANFRDKATLSELKVCNGLADFKGANFEGRAYFYDSEIKELNLSNSVIDKGIFFLDGIIKFANRETWRIIKHEFIVQNNKIESLKYHSHEMNSYQAELNVNVKREKLKIEGSLYNKLKTAIYKLWLSITFKINSEDKIILFLKGTSNNSFLSKNKYNE